MRVGERAYTKINEPRSLEVEALNTGRGVLTKVGGARYGLGVTVDKEVIATVQRMLSAASVPPSEPGITWLPCLGCNAKKWD